MSLKTNDVKELNCDLVRSAFKELDSATKNEIAKKTGLSISTCRNILNELTESGEIIPGESTESTGGRPSQRFTLNKDFSYIGTLFIKKESDVSTLVYTVSNLLGRKISSKSNEVLTVNSQLIFETADKMINDFPKLSVISIGIPGVVRGGKIDICDFPELSFLPLKELLSERFPINFIIENDVNAAALGFCNKNNYSEESFAYLYYPTKGIPGAGIVINGRVLRGYSNFAGEVAFLPNGFHPEEQGKIQDDKEEFFNLISQTLITINAIINPRKIVLSWTNFEEEDRVLIQNKVDRPILSDNSPQIIINNSLDNDYNRGLLFLGMEENSYKLKVVER